MRDKPATRTPRMTFRSIERGDRAEFVRMHEVSADFHAPWMGVVPGSTWHDLFDLELDKAGRDSYARMIGVVDDGRIAGLFNLGEIVRGFFQSAYAGWRVNVEFAGQ